MARAARKRDEPTRGAHPRRDGAEETPHRQPLALVSREAEPPTTVSGTENAYRRLRQMIISFDIRPGASLSERALEKILKLSRTPVRAALVRLEAQGLVIRQGRGYTVSPIDIVEVEQAFEFRLDVESACIRIAIKKASLQQMISIVPAAMGRTPAGEPAKDYLRNATAFHLALARLANNEFHLRALADVLNRLERVRSLEIMTRADRQRAWAERQRILNFVRLRDEKAAIAALAQHLSRTREKLVRALATSRTRLE